LLSLVNETGSAAAAFNGRQSRKEHVVRYLMLSLSAVALAVPAAVIPTDSAEAQYREWRGRDGRVYCRRPNGTTGLIVGGAAGALVGNAIDGGRNRTLGTVAGAAGGALLGREIQRSNSRRCAPIRR
jgi:uncharacterized protein YcfJ